MNKPDLSLLPEIQLDGDEPIFNEPWEAQAFAMVLHLHEQNLFSWQEWADFLSKEIHSPQLSSSPLPYYHHWLNALEALMASKKITTKQALKTRTAEWHQAAARTPHGQPILL